MNYYDSITTLHRFALRRHYFDPASRDDLLALKYFKENKKWKDGCPFYLEWPHRDIVTMCEVKFTEHMLSSMKTNKKAR